jgi:hypothetical protein
MDKVAIFPFLKKHQWKPSYDALKNLLKHVLSSYKQEKKIAYM